MKKIVILGYMGSGKSSVSKIVAELLNLPLCDLDHLIEQECGLSIDALFKTQGEIFFRKKEHEIFTRLIQSDQSFVLSLGGGTPCYANNHLLLQKPEVDSIYLKASIKTLVERLEGEIDQRPLLNQKSDEPLESYIAKHLFDRSYFYHQAHRIVSVDGKSIQNVAREIAELVS